MFDRAANLTNNQIINYKCDLNEKWLVLIGIAPGSSEVCMAFFSHDPLINFILLIILY